MRLIILTVFLSVTVFTARAQDTLPTCVKIAPIGLGWKAHIDIEKVLSQQISLGTNIHFYYNKDYSRYIFMNGYKADLYCRIYFDRHPPTGWYFQPSVGFGNYQDENEVHHNFKGVALSFGLQHKIKNSDVLLDFALALQLYFPYKIDDLSQLFWFFGGQGTFVAPRFSIGAAF